MSLAVVLVTVNLVGLILIGHMVRWVWSYKMVRTRSWCIGMTWTSSFLLFSGAVAANSFISAVSQITP